MVRLGRSYTLDVVKAVDFGFYLDAKDLGEVLLPRKYAPGGLAVGDAVRVFLYLDANGLPLATTQTPKAQVGQFAYLKVVDSTDVGAFLDWGLDKDLLVPFAEQHRPMVEGKSYLVYIYIELFEYIVIELYCAITHQNFPQIHFFPAFNHDLASVHKEIKWRICCDCPVNVGDRLMQVKMDSGTMALGVADLIHFARNDSYKEFHIV